MTLLLAAFCALLAGQSAAPAPARHTLDFDYFRNRVQPIFLKQRPGHARCIACHEHGSPPLQGLSAGASTWNEEQSRRNFQIWKQFVTPGEPMKSPLLLHPLAAKAGGDAFHAGGKHWKSTDDPEWQTVAAWVRGQTAANITTKERVLQSNSAGDNVHVIDPLTNKVVGTIDGIEVPHGVVISPDGARVYVTCEALKTLDVVDARTLRVVKRIPLSGRPNNLDVAPNGSTVYVGIRESAGAVDVIDTATLTNVKSVPVTGAIHNVYVTPDGKYAVAGSIAASTINVIDTASNSVAWTAKLGGGIRPMTFTKNADGSTKEIIVQLSDFHGFVVFDFSTRKEVRRVELPQPPGQEKETMGIQGSPSHGLALTPDGKILWATSKYYDYVAAYSVPEYKLLKVVPVGLHPEWLTIPPDGKNLYVAVAGNDITAVVEIHSMQVIAKIPVGFVPKRITSGMLQVD